MHLFTPDGKTLLYFDAFGLTRLVLPKHIKTERSIQGNMFARLSVSADGARALAWASHWDRMHWLALPDMKTVHVFDRFRQRASLLHPDGRHFIQCGVVNSEVTSPTIACVDPLGDALCATALRPQREVGARVHLGALPRRGAASRTGIAVAPDGFFALLCPEPGELYLGDLGEALAPVKVAHRIGLTHAEGYRTQLYPDRDDTWVVAHDVARSRLYGLRVDAAGRATTFELAALAIPARASRDVIAVQTSEREIERRNLSSGATERFEIPAGHEGLGEVIARDDTLMFAPWHREVLLDVLTGAEVPRKLPDKDVTLRRTAVEHLRTVNRWGRRSQRVADLSELKIDSKGTSFSWAWIATRGDLTLLSNLWASCTDNSITEDPALRTVGGLRLSSTGCIGADALLGTIGADDVALAFAHCDEHGLFFPAITDYLSAFYEGRCQAGALWVGEDRATPATAEAERMILRGLFHHMTDRERRPLSPNAERWRAEPIAFDEVLASVKAVIGRLPLLPHRALGALARVFAHHFGADAGPALVTLGLDGPEEQLSNSMPEVLATVRWFAEHHPESRAATHAMVSARTDYRPRDWGSNRYGPDRRADLLLALA